jgi:hypothetical protein
MSLISRRGVLALPFGLFIRPLAAAAGDVEVYKAAYEADVGILYDMLTLHLYGHIEETIDRGAGQYRVTATGKGSSIQNRFESSGVLRGGRWKPIYSKAHFDVRGRQSQTDVVFDWSKGEVHYQARGETFFLRRVRQVDDVLTVPDGIHIDDVMTATLNYADKRWPTHADGIHRTFVVRRRRAENEGPDDVAASYRAEIVPLEMRSVPDPSGKSTASFDLSRFSSWAKPSEPAKIVFTASRRPEMIATSMILGTSVIIRFSTA